jgi:hypothetical protein
MLPKSIGNMARSSTRARKETCGAPKDIAEQREASNIHAGSCRDWPLPTATSTILQPPRVVLRTMRTRLP